MNRQNLIKQTAKEIMKINPGHPVRVAVDGAACSGKTFFADEIAGHISGCGRAVIRATIDGFHNPAHIRHQKGKECPDGYYRHSFNHTEVIEGLLKPLGPGGSRVYTKSVYDYKVEAPTEAKRHISEGCEILIFDGIFLLRPEMAQFWDYSIRLEACHVKVLERAALRDFEKFGSAQSVAGKFLKRFIPGQKIYINEANPVARASVVIENSDYLNAYMLKNAEAV